MRIEDICQPAAFRVIEGGRRKAVQPSARTMASAVLPMPEMPDPDAAMLAREMGRLYALALLRDVAFRDMGDLNCAIWIDGATRITLHDLLCELSALSGDLLRSRPSDAASRADTSSLSVQGNTDHRLRGGGQYTLSSLLSDTASLPEDAAQVSVFLESGLLGAATPVSDIAIPLPDASAPMAQWTTWIRGATGACLPRLGDGVAIRPVRTPRDLAVQTHLQDPRHEGLATALLMLAQSVPLQPGLLGDRAFGAPTRWSGPRLLSLMIEAARRATRSARRQQTRSDRLARPAVMAARLALMHECETMFSGPDGDRLTDVLRILKTRAPRLLGWIGRHNAAVGTGGFALPNRDGSQSDGWTPLHFAQNIMLPLPRHGDAALRPADTVERAVVAGALITLLKGVFELGAARQGLCDELDALAGNLALGRCVAGGFYGFENAQNLRLGQTIALQLLRETLAEDGGAARLDLRDFDGRALCLMAERDRPAMARVVLTVDGAAQFWPARGNRPVPHLTAVV